VVRAARHPAATTPPLPRRAARDLRRAAATTSAPSDQARGGNSQRGRSVAPEPAVRTGREEELRRQELSAANPSTRTGLARLAPCSDDEDLVSPRLSRTAPAASPKELPSPPRRTDTSRKERRPEWREPALPGRDSFVGQIAERLSRASGACLPASGWRCRYRPRSGGLARPRVVRVVRAPAP
jgi:hypothetical protein